MKYKVGDKVKIKTWEKMIQEYGIRYRGPIINCKNPFVNNIEEEINRISTKRILTIFIKRILTIGGKSQQCYRMKETHEIFSDDMIECLAEDYKEPVPVSNRFEIMDFED